MKEQLLLAACSVSAAEGRISWSVAHELLELPPEETPLTFTLMFLAEVGHLGAPPFRRMRKNDPPMSMELETSEQECSLSQCPRRREKAL